MPHLASYLTNGGRLTSEDRVLLVGGQNCRGFQGTESTIQGSMTEIGSQGQNNILVTDGDVCFIGLETVTLIILVREW